MFLGVFMKKNICFLIYIVILLVFVSLTLIEIIRYLFFNSNLFGLLYLILNCFLAFNLFIIVINYKNGNVKIRISKNCFIIVLGLIGSFILPNISDSLNDFVDESSLFVDSIFWISRIVKPILYLLLAGLSVIEYKLYANK